MFPVYWGDFWSYLKFPNHLIVKDFTNWRSARSNRTPPFKYCPGWRSSLGDQIPHPRFFIILREDLQQGIQNLLQCGRKGYCAKRANNGSWKSGFRSFYSTLKSPSSMSETVILYGRYLGFGPLSRCDTLHSGQTETPGRNLTVYIYIYFSCGQQG